MLLPIVVAIAACSFIGYLWYSPSLFGTIWLQYAYPGKRPEEMKGFTGPLLLSMLGHGLVCVILYTCLQTFFQVQSVAEAVRCAAWLCALVCGTQIPHAAFSGRALGHYLIDHGYDATCIMTASVILTILA